MMTELKFTHVGMGNVVCASKIVAMIRPATQCGKRYLKTAKTNGTYIDACLGRPMKTLILMETGEVIGSAIKPRTLMKRCNGVEEGNVSETTDETQDEDMAADTWGEDEEETTDEAD